MKKSILLLMGIGSLALVGCNSDDDTTAAPVEPEPPVSEVPESPIGINDTTSLTAQLVESNLEKGTFTIALTGDDDRVVTGAESMNVMLFGYPTWNSNPTKYAIAWHQGQLYGCETESDCALDVVEVSEGTYSIAVDNIVWQQHMANYKVAMEVMGDNVHLEYGYLE
ncbi:hypothetical protein [Shewanella maritima]|uniref:hypothetical protein n=1 Tax=Shewanella maritima TaxID=2520507 RepID=UPI003734D078